MSASAEKSLPGLERNAVIAASAGTGKTHLITNVYLAHVLGLLNDGRSVSPERIVATTFSRAAAREIRERLELRLIAIAGEIPDAKGLGLDDALSQRVAQLGVDPRTLQRRASAALEQLPKTLIDTLHGLSARLLREHALELGLAPSFEILEEQAAFEDALNVAEDVLSLALGRSDAEQRAVTALLDAGHGLELCLNGVISLISLLDEEGLDADELAPPQHVVDANALAQELGDTARLLVGAGPSHPLRGAASALSNALDARDYDNVRIALGELFKSNVPSLRKLEHGERLVETLERLLNPSASKLERIRRSVTFLAEAPRLDSEAHGIAALIGEIQRQIRARRRARGSLGFGDLLRLSRDALRDNPAIAARAAASIELLLVDEFQDTSRVQRDLVMLLRERPRSAARREPGALPLPQHLAEQGLVVVGDRKQSIYAFRGADVSVYARLAATLAGAPAVDALDLRGVDPNPTPVAEFAARGANFRSGAAIQGFLNRVFAADFAAAPRYSFQIRYMPSEALTPPASAAGRDAGRVTLLVDDGGTPNTDEALLQSAAGPLRTALLIAGFCARSVREGRAFRDLAILARRRSTLPLLELALDRLRVPFVVAGRALYATAEVRDLAALLRWVLDPLDRHALATIARGPLGGLSDLALGELSVAGRGLLPARIWREAPLSEASDQRRADELSTRLEELAEVGPRLSPRDLLALAVDRFELERVLGALPRGQARFGNVQRLLEIASRHGGGLSAFVRWLERQITLEVDESEAATFAEDDDAVRLLTIHASKGLSFKVAIVTDLHTTEQPPRGSFLLFRQEHEKPALVVRHRGPEGPLRTALLERFQKDAAERARAERQRLFYVALTRAEQELVLALPTAGTKKYTDSLADSLETLRSAGELRQLPGVRELDAAELLAEPAAAPPAVTDATAAPIRPALAPWTTAAISVTALSDFALCARRFQLLHVHGMSELDLPRAGGGGGEASADARKLGSAVHRALERFPLSRFGDPPTNEECVRALVAEGLDATLPETLTTAAGLAGFLGSDYARHARTAAREVHRELDLLLVVERASRPAGASRQLELFDPASTGDSPRRAVLRATLDLVVEHADGSIDVIDYKRSRGGGSGRYALQLSAYRAAVERHFGARRVRTGLVHLLAESQEPEWLEVAPMDLAHLAEALVQRRYSGVFPGVERKRCTFARCGFLLACHPQSRRSETSGAE